MNTKALNFKLTEEEIREMKKVASVFQMTMTDLIREALKEYIERMKQDPYYRLTANIQEASPAESEEILSAIEHMSAEEMRIVHTEKLEF